MTATTRKFIERVSLPYFPVTYYLFSTCTLCYWRGLAPMIRNLLVYDMFYTCLTTSAIHLDYNPSRDQLRLDGFINCSYLSGYLPNAWTPGGSAIVLLRLLYAYHLAPGSGAWWDKSLSVPQETALMFLCWMLYNYSTIPDPRGFLRFILGRCLLRIISEILFQNKGFVQIIT
jgi:hypothetical protein